MTGIELNAEALAEKEYRQDEADLKIYESLLVHWEGKLRQAEDQKQFYTDKILEIHKKRKGSHEQR